MPPAGDKDDSPKGLSYYAILQLRPLYLCDECVDLAKDVSFCSIRDTDRCCLPVCSERNLVRHYSIQLFLVVMMMIILNII